MIGIAAAITAVLVAPVATIDKPVKNQPQATQTKKTKRSKAVAKPAQGLRWLQEGDQIDFDIDGVVRSYQSMDSAWNVDGGQGSGFIRVLKTRVTSPQGAKSTSTQFKSSFMFGRFRSDIQLFSTPSSYGSDCIGMQSSAGRNWFEGDQKLSFRPKSWTGLTEMRAFDAQLLGLPPLMMTRMEQELVAIPAGDMDAIPFVGTETVTNQMEILPGIDPMNVDTTYGIKIWYSLDGLPIKMEVSTVTMGFNMTATAEATRITRAH